MLLSYKELNRLRLAKALPCEEGAWTGGIGTVLVAENSPWLAVKG